MGENSTIVNLESLITYLNASYCPNSWKWSTDSDRRNKNTSQYLSSPGNPVTGLIKPCSK